MKEHLNTYVVSDSLLLLLAGAIVFFCVLYLAIRAGIREGNKDLVNQLKINNSRLKARESETKIKEHEAN